MILIADSGSSKTDWVLLTGSVNTSFSSKGYNPHFVDFDFIQKDLLSSLPEQANTEDISNIFFYGAGCVSIESQTKMIDVFQRIFPNSTAIVKSDLLAACRSLYGEEKGIAAILGTGSNCCYFDGNDMQQKNLSLGFLMGDEGSGGNISKRVLTKCLYYEIPEEISSEILGVKKEEHSSFISHLYSQERVNTFLASFLPKIIPFKDHPIIKKCIEDSFQSFFDNHANRYDKTLSISFVGSIAEIFQNEIRLIAEKNDFKVGKIIRKPIDGLLAYHESKL